MKKNNVNRFSVAAVAAGVNVAKAAAAEVETKAAAVVAAIDTIDRKRTPKTKAAAVAAAVAAVDDIKAAKFDKAAAVNSVKYFSLYNAIYLLNAAVKPAKAAAAGAVDNSDEIDAKAAAAAGAVDLAKLLHILGYNKIMLKDLIFVNSAYFAADVAATFSSFTNALAFAASANDFAAGVADLAVIVKTTETETVYNFDTSKFEDKKTAVYTFKKLGKNNMFELQDLAKSYICRYSATIAAYNKPINAAFAAASKAAIKKQNRALFVGNTAKWQNAVYNAAFIAAAKAAEGTTASKYIDAEKAAKAAAAKAAAVAAKDAKAAAAVAAAIATPATEEVAKAAAVVAGVAAVAAKDAKAAAETKRSRTTKAAAAGAGDNAPKSNFKAFLSDLENIAAKAAAAGAAAVDDTTKAKRTKAAANSKPKATRTTKAAAAV